MVTRIRESAAKIKADVLSNGGVAVPMDGRSVGVLLMCSVLLTLFYYYGRPVYFRSNLETHVVELLAWEKSTYRGLLAYGYWAITSTLIRIVIPVLCIWFWFKDSIRNYGYRLWEPGHGRFYLLLFLFMLPLLIGASFTESFQGKYPFYDDAGKSWVHFVVYELTYGIQFMALEAFFRGFLVFALFRRFGYYGVVIMTIPYCMIHFGKPMAETLGAVVAGLVLGFAALKSKSWLPGAMLHWGVGFAMDVACLLQERFKG